MARLFKITSTRCTLRKTGDSCPFERVGNVCWMGHRPKQLNVFDNYRTRPDSCKEDGDIEVWQ